MTTLTVSDLHLDKRIAYFELHFPEKSSCVDVNRFREIVMDDVPTWAIHGVTIELNTSNCYSEVLTQRLELIPISSDPIQESDVFDLDFFGDQSRLIMTKDLFSKKHQYKPVYPDMAICYLSAGQTLRLKAELKMGTGRVNAKWSPVTNLTFRAKEANVYQIELETSGSLDPKHVIETAVDLYNKI
jgi:DNA-directed RNA polymerase alpha subunit